SQDGGPLLGAEPAPHRLVYVHPREQERLMPSRVVRIARADLPDVLRARRLGVGRHRESGGGPAIQIARFGISQRARRTGILHWEEVDESVDWGDELEPLYRALLHRHEDRLATHRRIEREGLRRDRALLHQHVAGVAQDVLRRWQIADPPARGAEADQTDTIPLPLAVGVSGVADRLTDRAWEVSGALHGASHDREDDLRAASPVEQRLRELDAVSPRVVDLGVVEKLQHLSETQAEGHRVVREAPARLRDDRLGLRTLVRELHACPQR